MLSKHTRTRLIRVNGVRRRAHRVVMEQLIGRPLTPDEHVHHKDHNPLNNDPDNLVLMSKQEHEAMHGVEKQKYPDIKRCAVCGDSFTVNRRKRKRNKCCSPKCAGRARRGDFD